MKKLLESTGIDFLGLILMMLFWWVFAFWEYGANEGFIVAGFLFPLISYVITYKYYSDNFWKAFFLSLGIGAVLVFGSMALIWLRM